jgi:hypothetical protein
MSSVYVVVGHNHYGHARVIGVCPDEEAARERCREAFPDPDLYLSSCEVQVWEVGADRAARQFDLYPSLEDGQAMRDGLARQRREDQERRERNQLAFLQAKFAAVGTPTEEP